MTTNWMGAFLLAWAVWIAGMAAGFAIVEWTKHLPRELPPVVAETGAGINAGVAKPGPMNADTADHRPRTATAVFTFIFGRNLTVYLWLLAGLLSAGTITFAVLLANGIVLGQTIGLAVDAGLSPTVIAHLLLPHGALELGTFCIAGAVGFQGLRLAYDWTGTGWPTVRTLRLGLVVVYGAGALAAAAGLETVVTGALADSLGHATVASGRQD